MRFPPHIASITRSRLFTGSLLICLWAGFNASVANAQVINLEPTAPRAQQTVRAQIIWEGVPIDEAPVVRMVGNKILVTIKYSGPFSPGPLGRPRTDVVLGQLPEGAYSLEYYLQYTSTTAPPSLSRTLDFTVSSIGTGRTAPFPHYDYTDLWWNANESGWGINITVKNDKLFGAWFVYGADGKPTWYTIQPGSWSSSTTYSGIVVKAIGPAFGGLGALTGGVTPALAGNATLTFTSYDTATITGTVDGQAVNKTIARQVF